MTCAPRLRPSWCSGQGATSSCLLECADHVCASKFVRSLADERLRRLFLRHLPSERLSSKLTKLRNQCFGIILIYSGTVVDTGWPVILHSGRITQLVAWRFPCLFEGLKSSTLSANSVDYFPVHTDSDDPAPLILELSIALGAEKPAT